MRKHAKWLRSCGSAWTHWPEHPQRVMLHILDPNPKA